MKKLYLAISISALAALALGGEIYAQNRDASDAEALEAEQKKRAVKIPKRKLAAALRQARDQRTDRAEMRQGGPNLDAMRAEFEETSREDAAREKALSEDVERSLDSTRAQTLAEPPPPPPGFRAMSENMRARMDSEEVDRPRIPILLPAHPDVRDDVKIYGMQNVYTASASINPQTSFTMTGTCNRVVGGDPDIVQFRKRLAEDPPRLPGTTTRYYISRNDYGVDLSLSKWGCGYVMTIECDNPAEDRYCAGDDYIKNLGRSLILVNTELLGDVQ